MITLPPTELVLRVAEATLGAAESPAGSNAGHFVERCLKTTGNKKGDPWCAAWVSMVGRIALGDKWLVPNTASVQRMSDWAVKTSCRLVPSAGAQPGDLFVLWYGGKLNRHAHVGFVWKVNSNGTIITLEANTSLPGDTDPARSREGWLVASKTRKLAERDRLIRWTTAKV